MRRLIRLTRAIRHGCSSAGELAFIRGQLHAFSCDCYMLDDASETLALTPCLRTLQRLCDAHGPGARYALGSCYQPPLVTPSNARAALFYSGFVGPRAVVHTMMLSFSSLAVVRSSA